MENLLETYNIIQECYYKDEHYAVRDNGAVLRHPPNNKKPRPTDNQWSFGKLNFRTGYLECASVRIHRIVATAFHGEPPTKEHVVDHIDTNKQNNRPENLRWVTKFENILLNPITLKRIEIVCGSIEAFFSDPSKFRDKFQEPNYKWMCIVSKQEAETCKERLLSWANSDQPLNGGSLGTWIYNRSMYRQLTNYSQVEIEFIDSLTPNAVQKAINWKTPTEFPCCPQKQNSNKLADYASNLKLGEIFSRNKYASSIIENFAMSIDNNKLWIKCRSSEEKPIKPFSLTEITYQNNVYIHECIGTFFSKEGAEKQFTLVQGLEWLGADSIDDYC